MDSTPIERKDQTGTGTGTGPGPGKQVDRMDVMMNVWMGLNFGFGGLNVQVDWSGLVKSGVSGRLSVALPTFKATLTIRFARTTTPTLALAQGGCVPRFSRTPNPRRRPWLCFALD